MKTNDLYYQEWDFILKSSMEAFEYAKSHYDALMQRPVKEVLYGARANGAGAVLHSRRLTKDSARVLRHSNRKQSYVAYHLGENGEPLYNRIYNNHRLDCTVLFFPLGDTLYATYFAGDRNSFYKKTVFSEQYRNGVPVRYACANPRNVYVEYYADAFEGEIKRTECTWYWHYPFCTESIERLSVDRDAPFGSPHSPVFCGKEVYDAFDTSPLYIIK